MTKTRAASKATRALLLQALWFEEQLLPACIAKEWPQHAEQWRGECMLCDCENLCPPPPNTNPPTPSCLKPGCKTAGVFGGWEW